MLDEEYQVELFSVTDKLERVKLIRERDREYRTSRIICQNSIYPTLNFKYRDRSNIISTVNSSVDSYYKSVEFVKWLWDNYSDDPEWTPPGLGGASSFKYNFPNIEDNGIIDSEKLYFGTEYNNDIAEKLFGEGHKSFPDYSVFSVDSDDSERFKAFVGKFGVKCYPQIKTQTVIPSQKYKSECEKNIIEKQGIGASSYFKSVKYDLPYIENLETLLGQLSFTEIMQWLASDEELYAYISTPLYANDAKIIYCGNLQKNEYSYNGRIKNYILEVFNDTTWVELDNGKYSPREVLKTVGSRSFQKFRGYVPVLGNDELAKVSRTINVPSDKLNDILDKFEFAKNVTDLSSNDFYGLMLRIPDIEFSLSVDMSRSIYRIIEQASFAKSYPDSPNKTKFFNEGKVLVKYSGEIQYFAAKDAYLPSSKIISKKSVHIVEKGQRTGNSNFVSVFGCKEYEQGYTVIHESIVKSEVNEWFTGYFREFLKYAAAYGERNSNIDRYGTDLSVTLVSRIDIRKRDGDINVDEEYTCIRDNDKRDWYITVFSSSPDINALSEIIENIYSNIANTPGFDSGKIGELFRAGSKTDREFLIKKEFGSLNVIKDTNYGNEIKNSFMKTIKKLLPTYEVNNIGIDFDNFYSIKNSPYIISLFRETGIDVDGFIKAGFTYTINLVQYYEKCLEELIRSEEQNYTNWMFGRAKTDERKQRDFISNIKRFSSFKLSNIENSVYFDIEKAITAQFGHWKDDNIQVSAAEEYAKNYEQMNPNREFEDELMNDENAQRMIYFSKKDEFDKWLANNRSKIKETKDTDKNPYSELNGIIPTPGNIVYHSRKNKSGGGNGRNDSFVNTVSERHNRNKKIYGNKGELLAYNLLCDKYGKNNVYPRSEAFVELGIIKPGQSVSGEYDISYKDESGQTYFAEVKSSDGKSFIITPRELEFAKKNAENYKLILICGIDNKTPEYIELPAGFWNDEKFRLNEIVERIECEF